MLDRVANRISRQWTSHRNKEIASDKETMMSLVNGDALKLASSLIKRQGFKLD